jgi:alpha-L-rhamnosidase
LVPEPNRAAVIDLIRRQRLNCGIYGAPYFIAALFQNDQAELAYDLLTCKDVNSWHQMIAEGATTTFEVWSADQKVNASLCHPAGGTPVWLIIEHLMGLSPAEPGFKALRVAPRFPAKLDSIDVTFPTVAGTITARYKRGEGYFLTVPAAMRVVDETPESAPLKVVSSPQNE